MDILHHTSELKRKIIAQGGDFKTAKTYANHMALLMNYFRLKYDSPLHITFNDMEDYIVHLRNKELSPSYVNSFIASVKRFYKLNGQPKKCLGLVYHDNPLKTPNILTFAECMVMCDAKIYLKHRAIINLLYYGALRRGELLRLKINHLSSDNRVYIVSSKFRKSRVIPIPQKVADILIQYIIEFKPNEYLFNSDKGTGMYSAKSVENVIKNTALLCGIQKRVYPHILRSSRATHLLDNGASDMYVSEFLGHADIQTTRDYYCRLTIKGMQDNFEKVDEKLINESNHSKLLSV